MLAAVPALAAGCGRSGVGEEGGGLVRLDLASPGPAGHFEVRVGDAVIPGICPGEGCSVTFPRGTQVTLDAVEQLGRFGGWTGAAQNPCGAGPSCTFQVFVDAVAGADWLADVDVSVDAGTALAGRVVSAPPGIDCPGTCSAPFQFGSTVALSALTDGTFLTAWSGACSGDVSPCVFVADQAKAAGARFDLFRIAVFGSGGAEFAEAVAPDPLDPAGFFATGSFDGPSLSLSSTLTLTQTGARNGYVARFDGAGRAIWAAPIEGAGDIRPHAIATYFGDLGDGDVLAVYVGGSLTGEEDFDSNGMGSDPVGSINGFTLKFEDLETVPGSEVFAGNDNDGRSLVGALAVSDDGLISTGVMSKRVNFAGIDRDNGNQDRRQAFVLRQELDDGSGQELALVGRGGASHAEGTGIAIHSATGDPVVSAFHDERIDVAPCDGVILADAANESDPLTFRLQADDYAVCAHIESVDLGGDERWTALTTGTGDQIAMAGISLTDGRSVVVRAYDVVAGTETWRVEFPSTQIPGPFAVGHDPSRGEYVVAGSFEGTVTVGAQDFVSAGDYDLLVLRLDRATGAVRLARAFGGTGADVVGGPRAQNNPITGEAEGYAGNALAVLSSGHAVIAGWTDSSDISGVPIKNLGGTDPFVMRIGPGPAPQQ